MIIPGIFLLAVFPVLLAQDIVFPGPSSGDMNINIVEETNSTCSTNMVYIPEEDVCECESGTLYYAPTDSCYVPFQEGPCPPGKLLILPKNSNISKCILNTCKDGKIPYKNNTCIELLKPGPPCSGGQAIAPDEDTHELTCQMVVPKLNQIITAPVRRCMRGTRRVASGKCRTIL